MNSLLVLTDFSPAADHALHYAAFLAQKWNAPLKLLHVFAVPVSMNEMPVMAATTDTLLHNADKGLARLKGELLQHHPDLGITTESRPGDVVAEAEDCCKTDNPLAMVVGMHGSSAIDRLLFGSTALSLMKHASVPLFAVPQSAGMEENTNHILLVIDADYDGSIPSEQIRAWTDRFGAIIHVCSIGHDRQEELKDAPFAAQLAELSTDIRGISKEDRQQGLADAIKETGSGMLILLQHPHRFPESIFHREHTGEVLTHASIPVLCLHG
jgi:nucleotide-binding universal stress UspA family protein